MNPILLKTLISLAASNKKPATTKTVGNDAQLKNRVVLFADETVTLPDWGISGLPSIILGAAPQTCLFVSDLSVNEDTGDTDDTSVPISSDDNTANEKGSGTVSFSLTIKSSPTPDSPLHARTIVWKLTLPVSGFRDIQTGASSAAVHAPVIKTRIKLGGVEREVDIGLLEMGPVDQPFLIGKDTLSNKFLIRPDRPDDRKALAPPSVDLSPAQPETPKPKDVPDQTPTSNDAPAQTDDTAAAQATDSTAPTPTVKPAADADTPAPPKTDTPASSDTTTAITTNDATSDTSGTTPNTTPAQTAEQPADNTPKPASEPASNDTPTPTSSNSADASTDNDASKESNTADSANDTPNSDATPTTETSSKPEAPTAPTTPPSTEPTADTAPKSTETSEPKPAVPEQNPA